MEEAVNGFILDTTSELAHWDYVKGFQWTRAPVVPEYVTTIMSSIPRAKPRSLAKPRTISVLRKLGLSK